MTRQACSNTNSITTHNTATAALLLQLTAIAWLLAKLIGWKLWTANRLFPLAPVAEFIQWPQWVHVTLLGLSILLIVLLIWKPLHKKLLSALLISELIACLADQNRWQPWEYQYVFTIAIFIWYNNNTQKAIQLLICMLAGIYFYSGLSKCNEGYLIMVWDNMVLRKVLHVSDTAMAGQVLHNAGYLTAVMEMLAGIGLLFVQTRQIAGWFLMVMHLLLLLLLGPFGMRYNIIVWPWNGLMIALLYASVVGNRLLRLQPAELWQGWGKWVLICWCILPALNWVGYWDHYLSSSLYSGKAPQMVLCVRDSNELASLQPFVNKNNMYRFCEDGTIVNLQTWSMKEMNVPPYPEIRVYRDIEESWKERFPNSKTQFIKFRLIEKNKAAEIP